MIVVAALNIWLVMPIYGCSSWFVIGAVVATTAFQIAVDGLAAFVISKFPARWFDETNKHFVVSKRSVKFYEKLQIKKWKDKVLELGALSGFRKNKIASTDDPEYFRRFIVESNKGIVEHRCGYFLGFLGIFLFPLKYALSIGVPIAIVNLVLSALPTMILRYNIPKLTIVLKRLERQKEKTLAES
jgi:hypothetical protein